MVRNGMARDASILSLAAGDNLAIGVNAQRQFLYIENTSASDAAYVNYSGPVSGGTGPGGVGNTAASGSTGAVTIPNGTWIKLDIWVPQNPVVVSGTTGQPLIVIEG